MPLIIFIPTKYFYGTEYIKCYDVNKHLRREREREGGREGERGEGVGRLVGVTVQHHKHWCSSRGCRVNSLHLHVSQQPSTTPVSGHPIPSSSLQGSILMGTQIQRHTCRQTPIGIK